MRLATDNREYAEGATFAINKDAVATTASGSYTFSEKEMERLALDRQKRDADMVKNYDTVTIPRNTDSYAKFISAFHKAVVNRYKSWGNTYDSVRAYWNSANHRTDLSYFINTYITGGRSYDSTGNGYYLYYDKESKAACQRLVNWANFFRNSYEQFRNLPDFCMSPDGEYRYIINKAGTMCIRVHIPFDAGKKLLYYDIRLEDESIERSNKQAKKKLAELDDDNADDKKENDGTKNYLGIAAAVLGIAVIIKIIKKKGKA